jgi:hypothetical protein
VAPSAQQMLAIDRELLDSVRLIQSGFGQLQQLDGANDFYHMPLLTLSSGFERFLKGSRNPLTCLPGGKGTISNSCWKGSEESVFCSSI